MLVLLASSGSLAGQEALFQQGNTLYQEGDYAGAVEAYQAVVEGGYESSELYYNLGNAYFRLDDLARSVLYYERALRLDRGNDDAAANLALVKERLPDRIDPLPRFWLLSLVDGWINLLPRQVLLLIAGAAYLMSGTALVGLILRRPRGWSRGLKRLAVVTSAVVVVFGGTLLLRVTRYGAPEEAVVMVSEVSVLSAPSSDGGLVLFSLHGGTKVRIGQVSGDWREIVLEDGKVGWVRAQVLEAV
ncbi:MAG: tetratricopeptide repeat protein [Gemmatimonadetes bacterium]|nr:tetratricopeptide repeat protein [Gemmatimonadota bacterium]